MVSTQPKFNVKFQELAVLAIQRQQRGNVVMILNDDTTDNDKITYSGLGDVVKKDYTQENYDRLTLAFLGNPSKVIVIKAEEELTDTLKKLDYFNNYTLCYPEGSAADFTAIQNYIKGVRAKNNYSRAVLGSAMSPDAEYIINFATDNIQANVNGEVKTFTSGDYTARVAGALSGLASSRSLTYFELPEIVECPLSADPDADVKAGKLVVLHQDGTFKLGRAVNSLTTLTDGVTEAFQKIRVVDIMDSIANDIVTTFRTSYVGKFTNNFTNKNRFVGAINAYLDTRASEGDLEAENDNAVTISYDKTRSYLKGKGVNVDDMSYMDILKANTLSYVFLDGVCSPTDTMEDLDLGMYLYQALTQEAA
ncbi:MAG: hypothetical protein NC191_04515 [Muribaculaceae bacterium]|nr:hypothetical protein [Muribaculaceae bacterium]